MKIWGKDRQRGHFSDSLLPTCWFCLNKRSLDEYNDLEENWGKGSFKKFTDLKNINPGLKTLLAIGGWNEGEVILVRAFWWGHFGEGILLRAFWWGHSGESIFVRAFWWLLPKKRRTSFLMMIKLFLSSLACEQIRQNLLRGVVVATVSK